MQKAKTLATVYIGTSKNEKNKIFEIRNKGHPIKQ